MAHLGFRSYAAGMSRSSPISIRPDDGCWFGRQARAAHSPLEVLLIFLRLGCSCFGGPIAHLGYFRAEFVQRRQWLSDRAYVDLVALCQFLPGPASSQTGFGIGLMRGGLLGGLAAWIGFTMPSAVLMVLFAFGAGTIAGSHAGAGLLHGLKLAAVAIVAQAVLGMARSLCPDRGAGLDRDHRPGCDAACAVVRPADRNDRVGRACRLDIVFG